MLPMSNISLPLPQLPKEILLVGSDLNWDCLLKAASCHVMVPLLYRNLMKTAPEAVPPAIKSELQKRCLINARRCTLLTR